MKPAAVRHQLRKWTKIFLFVALFVGGVLLLAGVVMARPDKVSIVLQQVATNDSGLIVSTFMVQNPAWNSRVKAELYTEISYQQIQLSALRVTKSAGVNAGNEVLKKGHSAFVTCAHRTGDRSYLLVNFKKEGASAFYRRMTVLNEHAHRHWRFGKGPSIPLFFRDAAGGTVDLNGDRTFLH